MRDPWNVLDGLIVLFSLAAAFAANSNLAGFRGLLAVRCLRPLRMLSKPLAFRTCMFAPLIVKKEYHASQLCSALSVLITKCNEQSRLLVCTAHITVLRCPNKVSPTSSLC